jgi:hypothetical protein
MPLPRRVGGTTLDPDHVITGMIDPGSEAGDTARDVGNAVLLVPRTFLDVLFEGTELATQLVADEQLVPRYQQLLGAPPGGRVFIFPTLFAETGGPFSIGLRMIAETSRIVTSQRIGFGGTEDVVAESRVIIKGGRSLPFALSLETFYELESELEYRGLGVTPTRDERNVFVDEGRERVGLYDERQVRGLLSAGVRPSQNVEFFLSASLGRRRIEDSDDAGARALTQVFVPGSFPGVGDQPWVFYAESAARLDTRAYRGRPTPGALFEIYGGGGRTFEGPHSTFIRVGARGAGFIPVYRRSNILSPRLVVDRLYPLTPETLPFTEIPRQPEFRGFDHLRDYLSAVASIDYSWPVVSFLDLRLFIDAATVAPNLAKLDIDNLKHLRYAAGVGLDLFSDNAQLGRLQLATSPEGARLSLSFGEPDRFGDRQHRD